MSLKSTPPPRPAFPLGLVGMLVLVATIERGLNQQPMLMSPLAHMWSSKAEVVREVAKRCDVLCFGDSLVQFGVLPHVLSGRLQRPSYNLALPGGAPSSSYFLLERSLASEAHPSTVIVDFMPFQLLPIDLLEQSRRPLWPYLARAGDIVDLAVRHGDLELATTIGIARVLASMKSRTEIRTSVVAAFTETSLDLNHTNLELTRWNLRSNRGPYVVPDIGREPDPKPSDGHLLSEGRDPRFIDDVDRFLTLAASRGVRVYCLIPPVSPEYQAIWDRSRSSASYEEFLRSKMEQYPGLVVVDGRHAGYPASAFLDRQHLSRTGASIFSDDIATLIDEPVGDRRWINLPRFRRRAINAKVEDVNESRMAMINAADAAQRR